MGNVLRRCNWLSPRTSKDLKIVRDFVDASAQWDLVPFVMALTCTATAGRTDHIVPHSMFARGHSNAAYRPTEGGEFRHSHQGMGVHRGYNAVQTKLVCVFSDSVGPAKISSYRDT